MGPLIAMFLFFVFGQLFGPHPYQGGYPSPDYSDPGSSDGGAKSK